MKILIAVHHFPPRYTGGAELRACRTAKNLQRSGHTVQVTCIEHIDQAPKDGQLTHVIEPYEGIKVHRLSFDLSKAPDPFQWNYDNPWIGKFLRKQLTDWQPDVIHLIGGYLMGADTLRSARECNVPRVISLTDYWWLCPRIQLLRSDGSLSTLPIDPVRCARCLGEEKRRFRLPAQLAPWLMNAFWRLRRHEISKIQKRSNVLREELNQAHAIICPSQFLLDIHRSAGIDPHKLIYARQGRDFPNLRPEMLVKTPSDHLRLGYIGQITEIKGVHTLFQAVQQMPEANISIKAYGDPTHFPAYTAQLQQIASADKRIELAGIYPSHEISQIFQNLDVLVVPSLWYENSPNVILEAFAHHTPVLAANLGGMAELVQHEKNGLLFAPGDPTDLASQVKRLIDSPSLRISLSKGIPAIKSTAEEMDELQTIYQKNQ